MINKPNTVYEIRYDFDLDNKTLIIPNDCVLYFKGGSFSNGTINSDNCYIESSEYTIFKNIILEGTFYSKIAYSTYFEFYENKDNTDYLNSLLNINTPIVQFIKYNYPLNVSLKDNTAICLINGNKKINFANNIIKLTHTSLEKYKTIDVRCDNIIIENIIHDFFFLVNNFFLIGLKVTLQVETGISSIVAYCNFSFI